MPFAGSYKDNVFINCPFDGTYKPLFDAGVFAVLDAGFIARCALEISDGTQNRLAKILALIGECNYGIHDISRTDLDPIHTLPRFNMPLELGIFLGCKSFGNKIQQRKSCLVLDREPYRYQRFLSDLAGQDIQPHNNDPRQVISNIRNWLRAASKRPTIPGGGKIWERFQQFQQDLPAICRQLHIQVAELTFVDYRDFVVTWLKENAL
jgi:hypothetical protein